MERDCATASASAVEDAKRRCAALSDRLHRLPNNKLSRSLKTTLSRLIHSELNFLRRLSATSHPLSSNIGHLEAVVHVLQQPSITGVSRVCKPINLSHSHSIYVDIVCSLNGNPVWFIVSDRNPRYISWDSGSCDTTNKGLKQKIEHVVDSARQSPVTLRPSSVVPESMGSLVSCKKHDEYSVLHLGSSLYSFVSGMKCWCCSLDDDDAKLVNFDTTAMVAIVSGISNGKTEKLLATPESELRGRFKGNYDFVIAQVDSEHQNPIHDELFCLISGKRGMICESVRLEFQELISMCGGPNEKLRAECFLKFLK
ncbi:upf0415 protein c7orf25 homolog [Phtheirospermum japonicum]|uniref:Upf0415 protein c7orf25 homolog n=1 Tax=Phtheirospermum japonicum TaxID=374723 RepID=A0A830C2M4_9LAMI|nr:upf0415 protein c7orf25 homolog [Phtheirospermum japonicum]